MPRKVDATDAKGKLWNLYVNETEKLEFMLTLAQKGHERQASAAIRAFMYLYANDTDIQDKINEVIEEFTVYKSNGDMSLL